MESKPEGWSQQALIFAADNPTAPALAVQAQLSSSVNQALTALVEGLSEDTYCRAIEPARLFCVGGAVRDVLMQREAKDRDWLVVGSTPEHMLAAGFQAVGRDFPVFLHPQSHEEYALARTEKKVGRGYHGFEFYCDPDVSLEDDLRRRDLRMNAMAVDAQGKLHDPYQGLNDLQSRQFQHVSDAFREDPIRLLRVARFCARFPDFSIHPQTMQFMRDMVRDGETGHWTAERVWREVDQGMSEVKPSALWRCLADCHLSPFNSLADDDRIMLEQLDRAAAAGLEWRLRWGLWSALASPAWRAGVLSVLKMPKDVRSLVDRVAQHQTLWLEVLSSQAMPSAALVAAFFQSLDVLRRPERLDEVLALLRWHPDLQASPGYEHAVQAMKQLCQVFRSAKCTAPLQGAALGEAIKEAREQALSTLLVNRYARGLYTELQPPSSAICPP